MANIELPASDLSTLINVAKQARMYYLKKKVIAKRMQSDNGRDLLFMILGKGCPEDHPLHSAFVSIMRF